jgi:transcriptional regulator with XRE-family HTH domain
MLRIRAERLRRQWTQTDLAFRAGLATSDVSRIETGRFRPYPRQAARLAKALKLPVEDLLQPVDGLMG